MSYCEERSTQSMNRSFHILLSKYWWQFKKHDLNALPGVLLSYEICIFNVWIYTTQVT